LTTRQRTAAIAAALLLSAAAVVAGVRYSGARAPLVPPTPAVTPESLWVDRVDTLHERETLSELLARDGIGPTRAAAVLAAASPTVNERRVPAGMKVTFRRHPADSLPRVVVFQLAIDHFVRVSRTGDSAWSATDGHIPWRADTVVVHGTIRSNLYQALDDSAATEFPKGVRAELAWALADIFEYRVDMSRELQPGDHLRAAVVRQTLPGGAVRLGPVLAARFTLSGAAVDAIPFTGTDGHEEYFDSAGKSLRASFLRAPLAFRRVSSTYGARFHPILGIWRKHAGIDYAAAPGTPVRAIGDGTVTFAGRRGGYGNLLEIRHHNGFVSRYGHLSGFAAGIRAGTKVTIAQTVAYVGQTGLATGPHLHFELLVGGAQRDPRRALAHSESSAVPARDTASFARERSTSLALLGGGARAAGAPTAP